MANEIKIAELRQQLAVLQGQIAENDTKQTVLFVERGALDAQDVKIRAELLWLLSILQSRAWVFDSFGRLKGGTDDEYEGLLDVLGRHVDYHSYIGIDEGVELILSDGAVYLRFGYDVKTHHSVEPEQVKYLMRNFISKWGITISTEPLLAKRCCLEKELRQIDVLLGDVQGLSKVDTRE